jgi:hypothetical protein
VRRIMNLPATLTKIEEVTGLEQLLVKSPHTPGG